MKTFPTKPPKHRGHFDGHTRGYRFWQAQTRKRDTPSAQPGDHFGLGEFVAGNLLGSPDEGLWSSEGLRNIGADIRYRDPTSSKRMEWSD